jgi:hypothetical protein
MLKLTIFMTAILSTSLILYIYPPNSIILLLHLDYIYPFGVYFIYITAARQFINLRYAKIFFASLITVLIGDIVYFLFASTDFVKPYGPEVAPPADYFIKSLKWYPLNTLNYFLIFALLKFFYTHTQPADSKSQRPASGHHAG